MIVLTPEQEEQIIRDATRGLIERLILERRDDLELLTIVQVCALLNLDRRALDNLKDGPPRVTLVVGNQIRFRACDVAVYIERRMDKKGGGK